MDNNDKIIRNKLKITPQIELEKAANECGFTDERKNMLIDIFCKDKTIYALQIKYNRCSTAISNEKKRIIDTLKNYYNLGVEKIKLLLM